MYFMFLNYQHEVKEEVGRFVAYLESHLGPESVYWDGALLDGKFEPRLLDKVKECPVFLIYITRDWVEHLNRGTRPLLLNEIVAALDQASHSKEKQIVPVLVEGAEMPSCDKLPPSIQGIHEFQPFEYLPGIPGKGDKLVSAVKKRKGVADEASYIYCKSGRFKFGCPDLDNEVQQNEILQAERHGEPVNVNGFWIGETPVTVAQYRKFCEATHRPRIPSEYSDECPIVNVSWQEAKSYCEWAGGSLGVGEAHRSAGRLPTECQWEYAARAGTTSSRCGCEDRVELAEFAWFGGPRQRLMEVAMKNPNNWGLRDVLGNVWEWCSDVLDDGLRVARGGSYSSKYERIRVTARLLLSGNGVPDVGFRCVIQDASCLRPAG